MNDLRHLGVSEPDLLALPRYTGIGELHSEAEALGFAYVLEGATLGGRVICKHAADIGVGPAELSFFRSYGTAVGPMWRRFCEILETRCAESAGQAAAVRGALMAFEGLQAWLSGRAASLQEERGYGS
jgi:heme oxygenase